jgi:pilus assembly protein CpaB
MRTLATLVVAVMIGLVAVFALNRYMAASQGATVQPTPAVAAGTAVVVASQPIVRGATLQPAMLKVVTYPQGSAPAGAFGAVTQLTGDKAVQRIALHTLSPDEPVLAGAVSGPGGRFTLASVIDPGMQAVAIRSSDVQGVGGFLIPGDRVDVLLTRAGGQPGAPLQAAVTQVVAENLRVLGIDQSDDEDTNKPAVARAITIEVTPDQAQTVTLAQTVGAISLSLRHVADVAPLPRRITTVAQLGYFGAPAAARPPPPPGDPLYAADTVRVTRVTDTTGYRMGGR